MLIGRLRLHRPRSRVMYKHHVAARKTAQRAFQNSTVPYRRCRARRSSFCGQWLPTATTCEAKVAVRSASKKNAGLPQSLLQFRSFHSCPSRPLCLSLLPSSLSSLSCPGRCRAPLRPRSAAAGPQGPRGLRGPLGPLLGPQLGASHGRHVQTGAAPPKYVSSLGMLISCLRFMVLISLVEVYY